tara:strand:- start:4445 stop:5308 length:864 start_codon:yes stop_codon:yes gene_type:complete
MSINFNKRWKEHLKKESLFEYKNIFDPHEPDPISITTFDVHDHLESKIWSPNQRLNPSVKQKLLRIVGDFMEDVELDIEIVDIIITGSIANYNWTKFSDIDVHVIINLRDLDHDIDLVKDLLRQRQINWNLTHEIMIFDHEVEIYMQDKDEKHVATGIYSILGDRWLIEPTLDKPNISLGPIEEKVTRLVEHIDKVQDLYNDRLYNQAFDFAGRIKRKIRNMRRSGLEKNGIFSTENLAFKYLRNSQYLDTLHEYYTMSYDKMMGLSDKTVPTRNIPGDVPDGNFKI